jgi:hemoglobin
MRDTPRPAPTRDLDSPEEIEEMVRRFYADVAQDDLLGPMFNDVAQVDWAEHLTKLAAFWYRALLGITGYSGNPFHAHLLVHEKLELGWVGPNTRRAAALADNVARVHSHQLIGEAYLVERVPQA